MRTRDLGQGLLCLTMILVLAACYASSGNADGTTDVDVREENADCVPDMMICDAIYIPLVTFTFTDASTGEPFCGTARVYYMEPRCGRDYEVPCGCFEGEMIQNPDSPYPSGELPCHVSPPVGETSTITVTVTGYRDFVQDVTLPYECHPTEHIDVLLEPL